MPMYWPRRSVSRRRARVRPLPFTAKTSASAAGSVDPAVGLNGVAPHAPFMNRNVRSRLKRNRGIVGSRGSNGHARQRAEKTKLQQLSCLVNSARRLRERRGPMDGETLLLDDRMRRGSGPKSSRPSWATSIPSGSTKRTRSRTRGGPPCGSTSLKTRRNPRSKRPWPPRARAHPPAIAVRPDFVAVFPRSPVRLGVRGPANVPADPHLEPPRRRPVLGKNPIRTGRYRDPDRPRAGVRNRAARVDPTVPRTDGRRLRRRRAPAGPRVLDVGCGTGVLAIFAALSGASHVTSIDVDPLAVDVTKVI